MLHQPKNDPTIFWDLSGFNNSGKTLDHLVDLLDHQVADF